MGENRELIAFVEEVALISCTEERIEWFTKLGQAQEMVPQLQQALIKSSTWNYRVAYCPACEDYYEFHIPSEKGPSLFLGLCNCHEHNLLQSRWTDVALFFMRYPGLLDLYVAFQLDAVGVEEAAAECPCP